MIDFRIVEAISARINKEEVKLQKDQTVSQWKKDKEGLERLRNLASGG